ncbi:MAG: hypothetical protein KGJ66_07185 [Alphaproteobacteria bacterium]|nr:hypothetical protein [Alphaproteobacteria bacterium]
MRPRRVIGWVAAFVGTVCVVAIALFILIAFRRSHYATNAVVPIPNYKRGFSSDDVLSNLRSAAQLRAKDGVRFLFQTTTNLRVFVAVELQRHCAFRSEDALCSAKLGEKVLEDAITQQIDAILTTRLKDRNGLTSAYYTFPDVFAFSAVAAFRSDGGHYASVFYELPPRNGYTWSWIQIHYGRPDERQTDSDANPTLIYKTQRDGYRQTIKFSIDRGDGDARQIDISVDR